MESVHQWAQRFLVLLLVGGVLPLGYSTALTNGNNTQHFRGMDYDYLSLNKDGAKPLTLTQLTDLSGSPSSIAVSFTSQATVTGITSISLVLIKHNGDGISEQSWVDTEDPVTKIEADTPISLSFPYVSRLPEVSVEDTVTLVVVAHNGDDPLAAGVFKFEVQSTSASLVWVGAASNDPASFLRVDTSSKASIGSVCIGDGTQPFYCPQQKVPETLEICVEVIGTGNGGVELKPLQCDDNETPTEFVGIKSIENAELHTKADDSREFETSATYKGTSTAVQILFYKDSEVPLAFSECDPESQPCKATPPDDDTFKFLLVALDDNNAVIESTYFEFVDYSVDVNQLSIDAVEVTWSGSTSTMTQELSNVSATTEYEVTIDDDSAAFTKIVIDECYNDACKSFFVKTTASTIKCSVYKTASPTMKTSRSLDMVEESAEPLTLTRISDLSKSANPIKVGFSNNAAVTDITELFLVVIKHEDSNPFEQSWVDTMDSLNDIPENNEEVIFSFPYDDDRLPKVEDGDDVTLVVVAHAGEIALAAGEFTFVFDASTSASLAWVGAAKDNPDAFLRVNTESSVNIGSGCSGGDAGTFYCPQPNVDLNDLEICVEVEGTGNDGSGLTVSQCDESVTPKAFTEISAIGNTELHIKTTGDREFEISATYLSSSTKVDVLFYEDDVPSTSSGCDANKDPCQVEAPAVVANILLVGLTSDDEVVESKIITTFEEYSVVLNQLSADAVEVTWSGSTATSAHKLSNLSATTEYEVTIDDDSAPFKKTVGNGCDNGDCKAYFVKTTSIIKCSVYQTAKPSMKSSRSLDMTATPPTQAKFTFINKMDSSISIDVTSDSQLTSDVVSLVVITVSDAEGKEEITEGTQALVRADSKYQFPVDLPTSGAKLYFILVGHQQNGDIAFAGTNSGVLNGFTTTLAWVGAATSQDSNDASLKISTSDDVTLSEDCACIVSSNTPCYCIHTDLKEEDILLCSNLDDDGAKYCDNSIGVDQYIDFTNIKKSRLFYPLDSSENPHYEFESEVASDSTYEIQFLIGDTPGGDGVYTCGDASTCSVPLSNIPGNYQIYQVLTVATDGDGDIQKSREFPFEDYKTTVQPLLPDMILVNWEATEDTTYIVDCIPVTPGAAEPLPTSTHCDGSTVTCKALFTSLDCDNKIYTLEVKKDSDKNVVAGQVETLACNAKDLSVSTPELRYDDHISVCFSKPPSAHHYQLVLAHDGVVIEAELIDAAQVDVDNEGRLCLVSSRILSLGSYVDLVAVVVVYDNDGNIITSGKTNWQAILLSSDRWVQAAITDGTTMISSWQVIDDSQGISNFELTLKSDKGTGTKVIQVSSEQTSYKVSDIAAGSYSVCVRAVSSTIKSEEVCSGIITVNENAGIDIPPPETTQPKSSGNDSVMLTWSHQEDVTAYMVHWRSNSALSQSKLFKKLNSLSFVHPIKYRVDESEGLSFKIIPSSSSSFEISGLGKGEWNVCLSGVKDGNVGKESCQQSHVDPDSYEEIKAPENLLIEDSVLKWDVINDADSYYVEWVPHSSGETGGHNETSEASFNLEEQASPGDWTFTVRAVKGSQLGNTQSIRHTLIGIQLNWYQVGSRSLLVDWQEMPAPETSNATYVVSYKQGDDNAKTTEIDCKFDVSGSCQVYLLDIDVDTSKVVSLLVARKEGDTKRDISIQLRNLKDTTQLEQTMKSSNQAIVSWTAVDGADCYNVSLLRNQELLTQKWQTLPLSITFDDEQLEGCDVRVQPCIDQKHCMDGKQIQLNIVAPNSSGDEGGVVVVSVLGGVLGAAVLVMAIIVVVYKYKTNQREAIGSQHYSDASGGDRARRVSTVSILGQTQMNNQMELQPSRPTRPT